MTIYSPKLRAVRRKESAKEHAARLVAIRDRERARAEHGFNEALRLGVRYPRMAARYARRRVVPIRHLDPDLQAELGHHGPRARDSR